MKKEILIVIRRGPYDGFQAAEGLRLANGAIALGFWPIVVLVDDGVYLAKSDQNPGQSQWLSLGGGVLEEVLHTGIDAPAKIHVEKKSLMTRGLDPEELAEDLELIDHCKVSELLAVNRIQLIF